MTWTTTTIAGKEVEVFTPSASRPRFGLVYLHSGALEKLSEYPKVAELLERFGMACLSPRGGLCWWADRILPDFDPRISAEQFVLQKLLPYFLERWQLAPPRLGICGISMGGQGALRMAFRHAAIFPAVAGISSSLDCYERFDQGLNLERMYESKEQCRQDTALMHIDPYAYPPHIFFCCDPCDFWHRGNDRLHEKLTALGVAHTCDLETEAGGHSWEYFNHKAEPAIRYVYEGLDKESRRLL